jgi:hypothetical protein
VEEKKEKDPWLSMTLEVEPGRQPFVLVVPLGLNREQRAAVMRILADVLESMKRAYDPQICPHCAGTGDLRDGHAAEIARSLAFQDAGSE